MNSSDLDALDAAVAAVELSSLTRPDSVAAIRAAGLTSYKPTRDPLQTFQLIDKYIARIIRIENGWAAVCLNGRASIGPTLSVAVCRAVLDSL